MNYSVTNEAPGIAGSMAFAADERTGILRVKSEGFWSVRQITDYFRHYNACVCALHKQGVQIASICDLRDAAPQSQEVSDLLNRSVADLYKLGDRVAMIVPSSLVKMQMRRILDGRYHGFFLSLSAGEQWALAHRHEAMAS